MPLPVACSFEANSPRFGLDSAFERYPRVPFTLRRDRMDAALDLLSVAWTELDHPGATADTDPVAVAYASTREDGQRRL